MMRCLELFSFLSVLMLLSVVPERTSASGFARQQLEKHNYYRSRHGAPALRYDKALENAAQAWATHLASIDRLVHDTNKGFVGENIAQEYGSASGVTKHWYDEESIYNYGRPGFSMATGHFTQIVWIGTSNFGIAKATAASGKVYVVARYSPPGNFRGQFPENVKRPR